jgi:hypothetical protein
MRGRAIFCSRKEIASFLILVCNIPGGTKKNFLILKFDHDQHRSIMLKAMGKSMRIAMGMPKYRRLAKNFCKKEAIENVADVLHSRSMTVWSIPAWHQYFEPADIYHTLRCFYAPDCVNPASIGQMMLGSNCNNRSISLPVSDVNPVHGHPLLILPLPASKHQPEADFPILLDEQLLPLHACGAGYLRSSTLHPTANAKFAVMPALLDFWSCREYDYQSPH